MTIDPYILTFALLTVVATIWMGFWSARKSKTASDFYVAGRSVSVGWNASAISGEYLSAASFMGVAGMVMSSGYDALWYPVCYACGYLFLLLFIAGPLRRFGAYTIPDFAEGRFDSPLFRKVAVVFVLFIGFFYTMPQMKGAGTTLAYIFPGLPYWAGVVLVGAVITLNVALGGMKGVTLVQAFQYWAKMFAISVPVFVLMAVYGHYGKQLEIQDRPNMPDQGKGSAFSTNEFRFEIVGDPASLAFTNLQSIVSYGKALLDRRKLRRQSSQFRTQVAGMSTPQGITLDQALLKYGNFAGKTVLKANVFGPPAYSQTPSFDFNTDISSGIPLVTFMEQRLKTGGVELIPFGEDLVVASSSRMAARVKFFLGDHGLSQARRHSLPTKAPADPTWLNPFGPLTTKAAKAAGLSIEQQRPYSLLYTYSLIIALVCGTAGLPHILVRFYTNPDGVAAKRTTMWVMILIGVFYLFPPVFGVMGRNLSPELYNGLSGVKGTDGVVLKLPLILKERFGQLGPILSGITCAGAFAAFMSTFSGLLVSITGALAHDIYGRILRPKSTSEQRMRAFKVCTVICGGLAVALGFLVESFEINKLVGWAFAIAATSYFPLLFLSTWWRSITMKGAATGMLVGGTLSLATVVSTMLADQAKWAEPLKNWFAQHPLERTLAEQPAIWALPLAIGLMIFISKLTRKEIPSDVRMKMLVLHAPEKLGLKQEYIQEHQHGH